MRFVIMEDAGLRRMVAGVLFFMATVVGFGIWRGDSLTTMLGAVLASVLGGGFVIAVYLWARRKN